MKLAFFDTKPYDKPAFETLAAENGLEITFFEPRLCPEMAPLCRGYDAVCIFVNDVALENIAETTVQNILAYFGGPVFCDNELCYRCGNIEHCMKNRTGKCF